MPKFSICFPNKIYSIGGSGTFLKNFKDYLIQKKISVISLNEKKRIDFILITGSNLRNLIPIIYNKILGSKIINRVDGKNWAHKYNRKKKLNYIFFTLQNFNVLFFQILSNKIIYQSNFVRKDWGKVFFNKKSIVIYNGAKSNFKIRNFTNKKKPTLISVEGSIDSAFNADKVISCIGKNYRYEIYGKVSKNFKEKFKKLKNIIFYGQVPRSKISEILKKNKKYIFISLEMFAPCPNSVIESINNGIPVIGYDQGSMRELIKSRQGKLLKVNSDLNFDQKKMISYINTINRDYKSYNLNLKKINNKFKLDYMLKKYESEIYKTK